MTDFKQVLFVIVLIVLVVWYSLVNCVSYVNGELGLKDDNLIESVTEDMIESYTGVSIDLTPSNPDDDDYTIDVWEKD